MTNVVTHFIARGLDIPIDGVAPPERFETIAPAKVAAIAPTDTGLRWRSLVREGDQVQRGDPLLACRERPRVCVVAPASGQVAAIDYGEQQVPTRVVLDVDASGPTRELDLPSPDQVASCARETLAQTLREVGLWPLVRERPLGRMPMSDPPRAVFVNAMDTEPLAADPAVLLAGREDDLGLGLAILRRLSDAPIHVAVAPNSTYPRVRSSQGIHLHEFVGPHPAGLPGTHINRIAPVRAGDRHWTIRAQDVVRIGEAARTKQFPNRRLVAIAGPRAAVPGYYRVHEGAPLSSFVAAAGPGTRLIEGTVLSGIAAESDDYLSPTTHTITVIDEGRGRQPLFGWAVPRVDRPSAYRAAFGWLRPRARYSVDARLHGEPRALVNLGKWDKVVPLDVQVSYLVRAIQAGDLEEAIALGLLDVIEEDVALCSFVDPCKLDVGAVIRQGLNLYAQQELRR